MKNAITIILGVCIAALLVANLFSASLAARGGDDLKTAYLFKIVHLNGVNTAEQQILLNDWGANGWELVTVDENRAYFRREAR